MDNNTKRYAPFGGRSTVKSALPLPKPRPPLDSSPTPVLDLGYRDLSQKFLLLASRFESQSFVFAKNIEKIDIGAAKECKRVAENIRKVSERIANWPNLKLSNTGLTAEKSWAADQFLIFIDMYHEMVGERPHLNG